MKCKLCTSRNVSLLITEHRPDDPRDYHVGRCRDCGVIQAMNHYEEVSPLYVELRREMIDSRKIWIHSYHKHAAFRKFIQDLFILRPGYKSVGGTLLDIGCATGGFLDFAEKHRFECYGFDPSEAQIDYCRRLHPYVRRASSPTEYLGKLAYPISPNVITLWDVLEHLREPKAMLKEIRTLMSDEGVLFIAIPNARAAYLKYRTYPFIKRRVTFDPWEHVFFFSHSALHRLLREMGFRVLAHGGVPCYPRPLSLFEVARRTGFFISNVLAPGLAPQIYAFAEKQ